MSDIKIERKGDKIRIITPYNGTFVKRIKKFSCAEWTGAAWTVDYQFLEVIREIIKEVYGYTDIEDSERVMLKITAKKEISVSKDDIIMFGKNIVAHGSYQQAKIGDDVAFLKGKGYLSGSFKNWDTTIEKDSVFIIKNVVKELYLKEKDNDFYSDFEIEMMETENLSEKEYLEKEKEELEERLEKINKRLKEL